MIKVTLSKGGTAEQVVDINQVTIPDLWHIAELFGDAGNKWEIQAKIQEEHHLDEVDPYITIKMRGAQCDAVRELILECWHRCHDFKNNIIDPDLVTRS